MQVNWDNIETYISKVDNPKGNILFLHGFTGNFNNKISFRNFFSDYNFFGINMPGHGNSKYDSIDQLNQDYYVNLVVEFINLNQLDNLIILGHSMGGGIAILVYSKLKDKIAKLILEGPANKAVLENRDLSKKLIPNSYEETKEIMSKLFYEPAKFFGSQQVFELYCLNEYNTINKKYRNLINLLNIDLMTKFFNDIQVNLSNIQVPTLLVMGKHDEIVPYQSTIQNFTTNVNSKYLAIIECDQCSHLPLTENKELLPKVKQFIEN